MEWLINEKDKETGWMNELINKWKDGWMNDKRLKNEWKDEKIKDVLKDRWIERQRNGWMDWQVDKRKGGWMDKKINGGQTKREWWTKE